MRHAIRKPLIQLLTGEDALPFDIYDTRTIIFDIRDLDSVEGAKRELTEQLAALAEGPKPAENPIAATIDLEAYRNSGDVGLTQVLSALADLRAEISSVRARLASTAETVNWLGKETPVVFTKTRGELAVVATPADPIQPARQP